jgi:hypothetical protein
MSSHLNRVLGSPSVCRWNPGSPFSFRSLRRCTLTFAARCAGWRRPKRPCSRYNCWTRRPPSRPSIRLAHALRSSGEVFANRLATPCNIACVVCGVAFPSAFRRVKKYPYQPHARVRSGSGKSSMDSQWRYFASAVIFMCGLSPQRSCRAPSLP